MTREELNNQIIEEAKVHGLEIAEDAAEKAALFALAVVGKVVAFSENKYDDMVWAAVEGKAKEIVLELVDKIDGVEG